MLLCSDVGAPVFPHKRRELRREMEPIKVSDNGTRFSSSVRATAGTATVTLAGGAAAAEMAKREKDIGPCNSPLCDNPSTDYNTDYIYYYND